MVTYVIAIVLSLLAMGNSNDVQIATIPPMPSVSPRVSAEMAHEDDVWCDAYDKAEDEFTALFNAIEFRVSKNGRSMVRRPGDKSFRFVKKG